MVREWRVIQKGPTKEADKPVGGASYPCTTIDMEMWRLLRCRELLYKHYKYDINIATGWYPLSGVSEHNYDSGRPCFYVPLRLLEVGFTLPSPPFICDLLYLIVLHLGSSSYVRKETTHGASSTRTPVHVLCGRSRSNQVSELVQCGHDD